MSEQVLRFDSPKVDYFTSLAIYAMSEGWYLEFINPDADEKTQIVEMREFISTHPDIANSLRYGYFAETKMIES